MNIKKLIPQEVKVLNWLKKAMLSDSTRPGLDHRLHKNSQRIEVADGIRLHAISRDQADKLPFFEELPDGNTTLFESSGKYAEISEDLSGTMFPITDHVPCRKEPYLVYRVNAAFLKDALLHTKYATLVFYPPAESGENTVMEVYGMIPSKDGDTDVHTYACIMAMSMSDVKDIQRLRPFPRLSEAND